MSGCTKNYTVFSCLVPKIPCVPVEVTQTLYGGHDLALALIQNDNIFEAIAARDVLSESEYKKYLRFPVDKRKREFLLGRVSAKAAISALCVVEDYRRLDIENGVFCQPLVSGAGEVQVSIAHSGQFGFSAACHQSVPIGVDLEWIDEKNRRAMLDYLSEREIFMAGSFTHNGLADLHIIWTAKEGLAKVLRCGLYVDRSVLEVKSVRILGKNVFAIDYERIPGYRCIGALVNGTLAASLVFPNKLLDESLMCEVADSICSLVAQNMALNIGG